MKNMLSYATLKKFTGGRLTLYQPLSFQIVKKKKNVI